LSNGFSGGSDPTGVIFLTISGNDPVRMIPTEVHKEVPMKPENLSMKLENLSMKPFSTTLLGVVQGVSAYFGLPWSDAHLFGATGMAFRMNIERALCPSGPYCWNMDEFLVLLENLGIRMQVIGECFGKDFPQQARLNDLVKQELASGNPCSLLNMENQLIPGYDDTAFFTWQPWPDCAVFPPATLTFSDWHELGDEIHLVFYAFRKTMPVSLAAQVKGALLHVRNMLENSTVIDGYASGLKAWEAWSLAVEEDRATGHGNWWNAMVWGECRQFGKIWLSDMAMEPEVAAFIPKERLQELSALAGVTAVALFGLANPDTEKEDRLDRLKGAMEADRKMLAILKEAFPVT
jgi:hypothetical protein